VPDFADVRLHVVTGKGGTGKTTVAAALALALASGGGKVLLAEVEGRQGIAQLFDTPPLPYEERKVAVAPGGGDVYALAIDPEQALLDYLHMFYKLSPNGIPARTLRRMGAIDFATTIAPACATCCSPARSRRRSCAAPAPPARAASRASTTPSSSTPRPPGASRASSTSATRSAGWPGWGPIKTQSEGVMAVLRSPRRRCTW
jgi:hypothetical protein